MKKIIPLLLIIALLVPTMLSAKTILKPSTKAIISMTPLSVSSFMLAWWPFDGKTIINGVVTNTSATTTNINGNMSNIASTTFYTAGKIGQGFNFDGVNDSIIIGAIPSLHASSSDMTVSAWIKPDKVTLGFMCIVSNGNAGQSVVPWELELNVTAARFSFGQSGTGGGIVRITNNTNLKIGLWYHVVAVRTYVSTLNWPTTLYLNGVSDGSGTLQRSGVVNQTVAIGKCGSANAGFFQGVIDDVRVYNKALSPEEVKTLYNNGRGTIKTIL